MSFPSLCCCVKLKKVWLLLNGVNLTVSILITRVTFCRTGKVTVHMSRKSPRSDVTYDKGLTGFRWGDGSVPPVRPRLGRRPEWETCTEKHRRSHKPSDWTFSKGWTLQTRQSRDSGAAGCLTSCSLCKCNSVCVTHIGDSRLEGERTDLRSVVSWTPTKGRESINTNNGAAVTGVKANSKGSTWKRKVEQLIKVYHVDLILISKELIWSRITDY